MTRLDSNTNAGFSREAVEKALQLALADEAISGSSQLSNFLEFVVTKKLDGEEEDIKAYSIAVDALGRNESFDPQESAVVRVAAGRLRQALNLHNTSLDNETDVRIVLAPGSYVPLFEAVGETLPSKATLELETDVSPASTRNNLYKNLRKNRWVKAAALGVGLLLLAAATFMFFKPRSTPQEQSPVTQLAPQDIGGLPRISALVSLSDEVDPDWFKRDEFVDSIGFVMSRFDDYQFMGVQRSDDEISLDPPDVDYRIKTSARVRGDQVRFFSSLEHVSDGRILWSFSRLFSRPEKLTDRNLVDIIGRLYSQLASPYGVIYADLAKRKNSRNELKCVILSYQYFYSESNEKHQKARACAEASVESGTRLPLIYAMLTFLYLDEYREDRNRRARDPLAAAGRMAQRAVQLGPQSARAHQAAFAFYKVNGQREAALEAGRTSIALNPYDTDILGDYAAWLISIGELEKGKVILATVEKLMTARPAWFEFYRFLGAQMSEDFDGADEISRVMDVTRSPLLALAVVIGAHRRGDEKTRHNAMMQLLEMEPNFRSDPEGQLIKRGFAPSVAKQLIRHLRNAGL